MYSHIMITNARQILNILSPSLFSRTLVCIIGNTIVIVHCLIKCICVLVLSHIYLYWLTCILRYICYCIVRTCVFVNICIQFLSIDIRTYINIYTRMNEHFILDSQRHLYTMLSSANSSYLSGQVGDTPEAVVTINRPVLSAQEEQEKQLAESIAIVESAAREMHKHMQAQQLVPVLRAACRLFGELRIRTLDPHNYYELYICAFDAAHDALYRYLVEEHTLRGQSLEKLYDVVQSAGAIVPRLYLLILVGAVYMDYGCRDADRNINAARRLEIFGDLLEMCTGVQHPTRGLFLRHFLLTVVKKRLPDDGCPDQPPPPRHHHRLPRRAMPLSGGRVVVNDTVVMRWTSSTTAPRATTTTTGRKWW